MASISFRNVSKIYNKGEKAVDNITLDIIDREFLVLVGPSGCGKSTTLRMIAGLESIEEGDLFIGEKRVNDLPPKDRDISIVFQNYALYPHMTAYDNLAFGLKIKKVSKKDIHERVMQAAKILEITDLLQRKPKEMSGGQRQRIAIGRAIVRDPKVFLFDEPLSNLDAKLRGMMRIEIARLHKQLKTTMVYVTHDQVEAMTLGDRIVVMDKGKIQQIGTPSEVYQKPKNLFVAGFIGSPPMNMISGFLKQENDSLFFFNEDLEINIPIVDTPQLRNYSGKEVTLGFRPEDMIIKGIGISTDIPDIKGTIRFVEKLGHENFAFIDLGTYKIVARVHPDANPAPDEDILFSIKREKMHFFDANSGLRIN